MPQIGDWTEADLRRFIINTVLNDPSAYLKDIIESVDQFKKLGTGGASIGQSTVVWPGAVPNSNPLSVFHLLGVPPRVVLAIADVNAGNAFGQTFATVSTFNNDTFNVVLRDSNNTNVAIGSNGVCYWLAIA